MAHTSPERQALAQLLIGKEDGLLRPRFVNRFVNNDRMKLKRWRDSGIPEDALDQMLEELRALIGPALNVPRHDEKSPPAWAEGLIEATVRRVLDDPATDDRLTHALARLDTQLERLGLLRDEPQESPDDPDAAGSTAQADDQ